MCHCIAIGWMCIEDAIPTIQVILHSTKNGLSIDVDINDNCDSLEPNMEMVYCFYHRKTW